MEEVKREVIKEPNFYKNHFSLTKEKQELLETALEVTIEGQRILQPLSQAKKYHGEVVYKINMSVYGELYSMMKHRTQFAFKGKTEHIAQVNIPNIAYPSQQFDTEIRHGSRDHVIIPDTIKTTFNLDIKSTEMARSVVNNVGRALVKKKVQMLSSKDVDTINDSDICDMYKDLYLSKKEREEKLPQGIQSANGSKERVGAKQSDGKH